MNVATKPACSGMFGQTENHHLKRLMPALVMAFTSCHPSSHRPALNYAADLGIAIQKNDHSCLLIANGGLSPGQRIFFVTDATPQTFGEAEILSKAGEFCMDSDQQTHGATAYSIKTIQGALRKGAPAFAIAKPINPMEMSGGYLRADLDNNGRANTFRTCTSSEGVHLTIWEGKPLEGKRKWHSYYYLGYDVTSNCTDSEMKSD